MHSSYVTRDRLATLVLEDAIFFHPQFLFFRTGRGQHRDLAFLRLNVLFLYFKFAEQALLDAGLLFDLAIDVLQRR